MSLQCFFCVHRLTWYQSNVGVQLRKSNRITPTYLISVASSSVTFHICYSFLLGVKSKKETWVFTATTKTMGRGVPSSKSQVTWGQSMQSPPLKAWKLRLTTSHGVSKSQVRHECLHDNTFWRWGLELVLRVGSSKTLDPTVNTSLANISS